MRLQQPGIPRRLRFALLRTAMRSTSSAIENYSKRSGGGLIIFPDGQLINNRELIVELAARYRLPAVYPFRIFPEVGGFYPMVLIAKPFSGEQQSTWTRY